MTCKACDDKTWFVATRSEGRLAIERCDACSEETLTDMDAAKLAQAEGIRCSLEYPCYLEGEDGHD